MVSLWTDDITLNWMVQNGTGSTALALDKSVFLIESRRSKYC